MRKGIFLACCLSLAVPGHAPAAQGLKGETKNALAVDPASPSRLYAGSDSGIYVSDNGGLDWTAAGLEDRGITDIQAAPAEGTLYAAAGVDGIFRSADAGETWQALASAGPSALKGQDVRALAVDRSGPSKLYAGTYEGIIFRSTDGGGTWKALNADFPLPALNALAVHPAEPSTLLAGTGGRGVLKSRDGGGTWEPLNQGLTDLTVTRLAMAPDDASIMVAGTYGGGVFTTTDGGRNWREANAGLDNRFIYSLAIASAAPGKGVSGIFGKLAGKRGAPILYTGVFGGGVFTGVLDDRVKWQSAAAARDLNP